MTAYDLIKKMEGVIEKIPSESHRIIKDNEEEILNLNRDSQLLDFGINSDGGKIFPEYTLFTKSIKRSEGRIFNRVTLFDTGAFYDGFKIKFNGLSNPFNIYSTDSKSSELQEKYGSSIFGLTQQNQNYLNYEIIKPELEKFIKQNLG